MARLPHTYRIVSQLPLYSVPLNARRPLRPLVTFDGAIIWEWLSLRGNFLGLSCGLLLILLHLGSGENDNNLVVSSFLIHSPVTYKY